jgi:hypothetical protein
MEEEETTKKVGRPPKDKEVTFTAEQLAAVNEMIAKSMKQNNNPAVDNGVSVYGQRDPKSIESVNVKRIFGKFVLGFKDVQNDPLKKTAQYISYQFDPIRKLNNQAYLTLLLSNDGKDIEEKEIIISDYYYNREYYQAKVVDIEVNKEIQDHGYLGNSAMAREIDGKGNVIQRPKIKAESVKETRRFLVELPGFEKNVWFIEDFLA